MWNLESQRLIIFHTAAAVAAVAATAAAAAAAAASLSPFGRLYIFTTENLSNFNFILPKVNTDYIRQAQVLNIDN